MKKVLFVLIACLACSWFPQNSKIQQILLDRQNISVEVGSSDFLAVNLLPEEAAGNAVVDYTIADPAIADCIGTSHSVKVSGISEGTTMLMATCGDVSQSCLVSVEFGSYNSRYLTCDMTTKVLETGKESVFSVELKNETVIEEAAISWQVLDPDICTLTGGGSTIILTPLTPGQTQMTISHPLSTNVLTVYVKVNRSNSALRLNTSFIVLDVGKDTTLNAVSTEAVNWSVFPEGVVTLLGSGNTIMVLAREPGTAQIRAATATNSVTCSVIVKAERMLAISPVSLNVAAGESAVAYVVYSPEDLELTIQNSNPSVASYQYDQATGEILVTGLSEGIASLNLMADGMQKTLTVNVSVDYSLYCSPTVLKIDPENPGTFSYNVSPAGYIPTFTVTDGSIAEITANPDTRTVTVTALKEGTTTILGSVEREHVNINVESWYSALTCRIGHVILKKCDEDDDNKRAVYENGTLTIVDGLTQQLTLSFPQPGVKIRDIDWKFSSDLYGGIEYQIFEEGKRIVFDFLVQNVFNHEEDGGNVTIEIKWGDNRTWSMTIPIKVYLRNG